MAKVRLSLRPDVGNGPRMSFFEEPTVTLPEAKVKSLLEEDDDENEDTAVPRVQDVTHVRVSKANWLGRRER